MSGPAFDALTQKRKKIATELAELETRVRRYLVTACVRKYDQSCQGAHWLLSQFSQIYNLETEYVAQAECSAFGTVLKVSGAPSLATP